MKKISTELVGAAF